MQSPGAAGGDSLLTVTVVRDEHGYGMKVSGDNPVYVQSVKEHGAAWRAGLRAGDRILRVDGVPVHHHTHHKVVLMIRSNPSTVLTVHQNIQRQKTPITAPVPVNSEKQRQLECSKVNTVRLMLHNERQFIAHLKSELQKVPDVRKQAELETAEKRCAQLQKEIDTIVAAQPDVPSSTPRPNRHRASLDKVDKLDKSGSPPTPTNTGFLSGLPRSLSNLTGQSLRNLREKKNKIQQENTPPLVRQNSDESNNRKRHNNTVPIVPTTCLDNSPPPLPPRSIRNPLTPNTTPVNPLAKPKPSSSVTSVSATQFFKDYKNPMHQSMPAYRDNPHQLRRSSHSLDGDLEGPQPNSIALQMSYPLVNAPPPPLQMDTRGAPVLHVRSQSSPEHLEHSVHRTATEEVCPELWERSPPPGTPPPPYAHNTQPCADPQRAIISMEEDDPPSENSSYSGLFSNLRTVRESKARFAVLLNWLLGERRCACAALLLLVTDGYRGASVPISTLRRWAYEIQSTFLTPHAALKLTHADEQMANDIDHILLHEYEKEEILRNVFRKARQKAKEELTQQLEEFQIKRQVGLGTLYGPDDAVLHTASVDKAQEQVIVERITLQLLRGLAAPDCATDARAALLAAVTCACTALGARPATLAAAVGGSRPTFLQRDKVYKQRLKQLTKQNPQPNIFLNGIVGVSGGGGRLPPHVPTDKVYKQRLKQLTKQNPQPFVVRGHHLQLQALTSVAHCHACDLPLWGLAPQAYVCTDCNLRVHRTCTKAVEEPCCLDSEHHNNRISRFMERIHHNNTTSNPDSGEKKSRKTSSTAHFLNMERSVRKMEDDSTWDAPPQHAPERRDESDESLYESADCHSDVISASDDALPRLGKTPTMSKESLKLAVTDEEVELRAKKGHRKAMSLSNPLEMVRSLEWLDSVKSNCDKHFDKKKSRESLWSEEDRESIHGSNMKLDQVRKNSKKEDKRKNSAEQVKTRKPSKASSVSALNLFRRKKTPIAKSVEAVSEVIDKILTSDELLNLTKFFLEEEKRHSSVIDVKPPQTPTPAPETDSDEEAPVTPKPSDHRRRLSRQASRSKSKARGKSQSVKVNTLRKSHSGTLKKAKKKGVKTPTVARSRQTSIVEATPLVMKKRTADTKQTAWLFSSAKGEARREGSAEDAADAEPETDSKDAPDKDNNWRTAPSSGRGVNRAESCRERDAPRRGKHRNASDPNRLTAHNHHDLEPAGGAAPSGSSSSSSLSSRSNESNTAPAEQQGGDYEKPKMERSTNDTPNPAWFSDLEPAGGAAPSGSSSSSSLSSRSNESNTAPAEQQAASQSDWSDEEEPLAAQWADSLPPHVLDSLTLTPKQRKRQEVIHELIVSERSHARWLKVLDAVFLRALEAPPPPLPPDELRALFPNLPAVRERHGRLYADLKALRAAGHVVQIRPVADAILNTLGDPGYAPCLSKFCRGQRMALEALRERRRKSKELHALLASREQLPLCGRLQLRDLLACVWQRLTKYQLLLESLLATVTSGETEADAARLRLALHTAKDVLHTVDTAVRTAENEHRLKSIQSKLEVRANGSEWEELRRLDLTQHTLRMEGDLAIRNDSNKKISVLALMLEDILVLLQREGDKFVLKPVTQPSQQGLLSPLIRWDKVLFRPNAAVRNAFFLMNINGVQMHELSTNTSTEYTTWVKHIQDAPLAKLTDLKPHQPRQSEDSGTNVSRNPSDASEKSEKSEKSDKLDKTDIPSPLQPEDTSTPERQLSRERSEERERERAKSVEDSRGREGGSEERERERHTSPRRPTVGRISTVARSPPPLEQVLVAPPLAHTCHVPVTEYTSDERLRRLDRLIASALAAKASIVGALLDAPAGAMTHLADIARADTLCDTDIASELRATRLNRSSSVEEDIPEPDVDNIHPLLLTAYAQATELTETLSGALRVSPARLMRARRGRCDQCAPQHEPPPPPAEQPITDVDQSAESLGTSKDASFDMLSELANMEGERSFIDPDDSASALATRLLPVSAGLQAALSRLLVAAPLAAQRHVATRSQLTAASEYQCRLRTKHQMSQEMNIPDDEAEETIQDQPSNGG